MFNLNDCGISSLLCGRCNVDIRVVASIASTKWIVASDLLLPLNVFTNNICAYGQMNKFWEQIGEQI